MLYHAAEHSGKAERKLVFASFYLNTFLCSTASQHVEEDRYIFHKIFTGNKKYLYIPFTFSSLAQISTPPATPTIPTPPTTPTIPTPPATPTIPTPPATPTSPTSPTTPTIPYLVNSSSSSPLNPIIHTHTTSIRQSLPLTRSIQSNRSPSPPH